MPYGGEGAPLLSAPEVIGCAMGRGRAAALNSSDRFRTSDAADPATAVEVTVAVTVVVVACMYCLRFR